MAKVKSAKRKQYPARKKQGPPSNLAEARARQGRPNARTGGGPPFRPKVYGDPETQI